MLYDPISGKGDVPTGPHPFKEYPGVGVCAHCGLSKSNPMHSSGRTVVEKFEWSGNYKVRGVA